MPQLHDPSRQNLAERGCSDYAVAAAIGVSRSTVLHWRRRGFADRDEPPFFTNYSADIRGIFCEHCDLLGIPWTQSNHRNISIPHRDSTAILDEIVGPKA